MVGNGGKWWEMVGNGGKMVGKWWEFYQNIRSTFFGGRSMEHVRVNRNGEHSYVYIDVVLLITVYP